MPTFSIDAFKQSVLRRGGFSRGHLFTLRITDATLTFDRDTSYFCRSTQLPSYTIETAPLSCMAMTAQMPGRRTYDPFTVTFYNTNNYDLYHRFVGWQTGIRGSQQGRRRTAKVEDILATIDLLHYNESGDSLELYQLHEAFPTTITGLSFSQDNESEFQTFDVTFAYRYLTMSDQMAKKAKETAAASGWLKNNIYGPLTPDRLRLSGPMPLVPDASVDADTPTSSSPVSSSPTPSRTIYSLETFDASFNEGKPTINGQSVSIEEYIRFTESVAARFRRARSR